MGDPPGPLALWPLGPVGPWRALLTLLALVVKSRARKWWAHMHKIKISNNGSVATDVAVNPTHGDDQRGRYRVVLGNEGFATGKHEFFIKLLKPARFLIGVVTEEITPEWREGLIETSCFREGRRRQTRERDLRGCKSLAQVRQAFTVCPPSNCSPNMAR